MYSMGLYMGVLEKSNNTTQGTGRQNLEFYLVVWLLIILSFLVALVLIIPIQGLWGAPAPSITEALKFRQEILTIIVTAFSAWIGAGAAYFFGRENMREATQGMLNMRQISPRERLRQIAVKELPPRPITWSVTTEDPLKKVYDKLKGDVTWWFIVVTKKDDGSLVTVLEEEALWRFIDSEAAEGKKPGEAFAGKTVQDLLNYLKGNKNKNLAKKVCNIFLKITNDHTVGAVNDQMLEKRVFLSIITDGSNRPVSYVSSDDIRREFMKMG